MKVKVEFDSECGLKKRCLLSSRVIDFFKKNIYKSKKKLNKTQRNLRSLFCCNQCHSFELKVKVIEKKTEAATKAAVTTTTTARNRFSAHVRPLHCGNNVRLTRSKYENVKVNREYFPTTVVGFNNNSNTTATNNITNNH